MIMLVDHYDSFTYNLYALFKNLGVDMEVVRENRIPLDLSKYKGIVLSPGPSHPSTMVNSLGLLKRACGSIPIFGVCLGMQLIGYFLGYGIRRAGRIMHGKKELIRVVSESTILKGLPNEFYAVRYHSLVVDIRDPKRVVALSGSDGEVMAFEFREKLLFGVQFHPESVESEFGDLIAKNFLEVCYGSCTETFKRQ